MAVKRKTPQTKRQLNLENANCVSWFFTKSVQNVLNRYSIVGPEGVEPPTNGL